MKKAVGYIRVSTEGRAERGVSLEASQAKIEAYAALKDLHLVEIVEDAGVSARSLNRPGMQWLLGMVHRKKVEVVVILKLDRMFRNTVDALQTTQVFDRKGVALHSIQKNLDTQSALGRFYFTLGASLGRNGARRHWGAHKDRPCPLRQEGKGRRGKLIHAIRLPAAREQACAQPARAGRPGVYAQHEGCRKELPAGRRRSQRQGHQDKIRRRFGSREGFQDHEGSRLTSTKRSVKTYPISTIAETVRGLNSAVSTEDYDLALSQNTLGLFPSSDHAGRNFQVFGEKWSRFDPERQWHTRACHDYGPLRRYDSQCHWHFTLKRGSRHRKRRSNSKGYRKDGEGWDKKGPTEFLSLSL